MVPARYCCQDGTESAMEFIESSPDSCTFNSSITVGLPSMSTVVTEAKNPEVFAAFERSYERSCPFA